MSANWKIALTLMVILATLGWLAYTGVRDSKSYFVTVNELATMPDAGAKRLRVSGDVLPGSIQHKSDEVDFVLHQGSHTLNVAYIGHDPLPDTFVDNAQAVAEGRLESNGHFRATGVQAKCASKYEPKGVRGNGQAKPRESAGSMAGTSM